MTQETVRAEPVHSEPALFLKTGGERILAVADTHIGMEFELRESGIRIPPQGGILTGRLMKICKSIKPDRLVHLGDLKHNIPLAYFDEKKAVGDMLKSVLSVCGRIDIVPGNHDGRLAEMLDDCRLPGEVSVHPPGGFSVGGAGFFHGHAWPGSGVISKKTVVMAHLHPAIRLTDANGVSVTERCWVRGALARIKARKFYLALKARGKTEVIVMPAFNPMCGSSISHGRAIGPVLRNGLVSLENSQIYLLNGTSLGKLADISS